MKADDLRIHTKIAAGVLFVAWASKKILLLERNDYVPTPHTWSLPGGKAEKNESPDQTARRETLEEIGFDLKDQPLKLIYTNEVHLPKFEFFTYAAIVPNEFKPKLNYENIDYVWCDRNELPSPLHWGIKQLFKHRKAMKRLRLFIKNYQSNVD
jgi:8-oxo-dGTP pyrophosphatase MutT (NUDIX family)